MLKGVIFDLDGTLIDPSEDVRYALIGICTNKPSIMTNLILDKLDLRGFFTAVVADESPFLKPDPRHIDDTLNKMNMDKEYLTVMVGDSDTDIIAAKKAGIPVIAAKYGFSGESIKNLSLDACIDNLFSLPAALKDISLLNKADY